MACSAAARGPPPTKCGPRTAEAVDVVVKWFDGKRGYGFVTVERTALAGVLGGWPSDLQALGSRAKGDDRNADVFLSGSEAQTAAVHGVELCRGSRARCHMAVEEPESVGGDGDGDGVVPGAKRARVAAPVAAAARLVAVQLQMCQPAGVDEGRSGDGDGSQGGQHRRRLQELGATVSAEFGPCLLDASSFTTTSARFSALLGDAWREQAPAGRRALEEFIQGPCFDVVQACGTRHLLDPAFVGDNARTASAAAFLKSMRDAPYCWTQRQRRTLDELCDLAAQHVPSATPQADAALPRAPFADAQGTCDPEVGAALAARTTRFVVVLEGVRNCANSQMIIRTCEAMGVHEVWVVPPAAGTRYKAALVRSRNASRGAEKLVALRRFGSAEEVAQECAKQGRDLWVTHCPSPGGATCRAVALTEEGVGRTLPRLALVLGTEDDGASEQMLRLAKLAVHLPLAGLTQSLNVAVACGMLLQRLFDLCPEARGDLQPNEVAEVRDRLVRGSRRALPADACAADSSSEAEPSCIVDGAGMVSGA